MLKIARPTISAVNVYTDCVSIFRDSLLKERLMGCIRLIVDAENELEAKITSGRIYTIEREVIVNGNVSAKELKKVYTDQMVGSPKGRRYYEILLQAAKGGLCPLCAQRDVTTLDHYLPKTKYPRLAVVPINLIPSCKDCNTGKRTAFPTTPEQETLHPYFDDIENDLWLKATVKQTNPVSIEFFVERAAGWDDLLFERVKGHFQTFNLKTLYGTHAGRELSERKLILANTFNSGAGNIGLKKLLTDEASSRANNNKNSWQTTLYTALAADDWFCNGGFRQIGG